MTRLLVPIALLACNGDKDKDTPTTGDTGTGEPQYQQVMRDCPTDVGNICPWAGAGYNGFNGDDVHRLDAWFSFPMSIAFPPASVSGRPILSDWNNHKLRAVNDDPEGGYETIMGTDFLGDGDPELKDRTPEGAPGTSVSLNHPTQQVYLSDGTLLSDSWHTHKFRTWNPSTGMVNVVFGSRGGYALDQAGATPELANALDDDGDGKVDEPGDFDQPAATTLMNQPKELFVDPNDESLVYYVDMRNERIRRWDRTTGLVNTVVGETVESTDGDTVLGSKGYCGEGDALAVCLNFPKNANPEPGGAIAITDDSATMYVADSESHVIRMVDLTTGQISLLSGTPPTYEDTNGDGILDAVPHSGFQDGPADQALWYYPTDFALDNATNELFVTDTNNHRVRKIDLNTMEVSTVAGNGAPSCDVTDLLAPAICDEQHAGGDGGPATAATLYRPFGVDLDPDGNLVIADTYDHRFRIVYR